MFKLVCVQFGIVTAEYFLDRMKPYELGIICESLHLRVKESWEQTRMISYLIAQTNSKKRLKPSDLMRFQWEQTDDVKQPTPSKPLTIEDVERIKAQAIEREKSLRKKGIIK